MRLTSVLPVDGNELSPRSPIPDWLIVSARHPRHRWIEPHKMRPIMFDDIGQARLKDLVGCLLGERDHVLRKVGLLLVEPTELDADGVNERHGKGGRELGLGDGARGAACPGGRWPEARRD